jgi:hypothetical protein
VLLQLLLVRSQNLVQGRRELAKLFSVDRDLEKGRR